VLGSGDHPVDQTLKKGLLRGPSGLIGWQRSGRSPLSPGSGGWRPARRSMGDPPRVPVSPGTQARTLPGGIDRSIGLGLIASLQILRTGEESHLIRRSSTGIRPEFVHTLSEIQTVGRFKGLELPRSIVVLLEGDGIRGGGSSLRRRRKIWA
jgi:hypothetical protein